MNNSSKNNRNDHDIEEKLVYIRRVAKVTKGGRKFSFSALAVVGDKKGSVGHGTGSGLEVSDARRKAIEKAKKNMFQVPLKDGNTLHHDVKVKSGGTIIIMRSAPKGRGIIASGPLRAVFQLIAPEFNIVAKCKGKSNPYSQIDACFKALAEINSVKMVANKRNKKVGEIVRRRDSMIAS